ncbi:MAG: hypothetical protein KKA64_02200 [Nanoarchaeota archaeon]|nr:hypothetical protein [Nanoarchaeota archaeon]
MKKDAKRSDNVSASKEISENVKLERILIENFISMQKVLTNLSVKFDRLSDQISKLLELFEISARALAEKDLRNLGGNNNKDVLEKLDNLLDQNKTIARGVALMHDKSFEPQTNEEFSREKYHPSSGFAEEENPEYKRLPKY